MWACKKRTFNLPNTIDRYLRGNDRGFSNQTLPDVYGYLGHIRGSVGAAPNASGVFAVLNTYASDTLDGGHNYLYSANIDMFLSRINGTYGALNKNGQAGYVMPYTTHCNFMIKY